ncbi:M15 family metallopeptidase [Segetibacter koreensis]|uniref:M15 family metallopeptidase n=1 Tax=Segetibacter koreensis TaxID=398037 RepID=UPI00068441C3|nr:M15 family metallopeptidase [Segetibacter koreensis]
MRHENKGNFLIHTLLFVITCSPSACSQVVNNFSKTSLLVISNVGEYRISIKKKENKRIVALKNYITPLITDFKYSTDCNFTHKKLYTNPDAYGRLTVAYALKKVQEDLVTKGLALKFFDAYRPYSVTKEMWKAVPDERYAANPAKGSGHNRGTAVDVTLVKIPSGQELEMPTKFDDFSERAYHNYKKLPENVLQNRQLLKTTMEKFGFHALSTEWWHYSLSDTTTIYEVLDLSFDQLKQLENGEKNVLKIK